MSEHLKAASHELDIAIETALDNFKDTTDKIDFLEEGWKKILSEANTRRHAALREACMTYTKACIEDVVEACSEWIKAYGKRCFAANKVTQAINSGDEEAICNAITTYLVAMKTEYGIRLQIPGYLNQEQESVEKTLQGVKEILGDKNG